MKKYNVTDGRIVLTLREDLRGWYTVTSPTEPALITQAKTINEAFRMARDAIAALTSSRADPHRWNRTGKARLRRSA